MSGALRAPWWLPGGQAQTIWSATLARHSPAPAAPPRWRRERWTTPDGDFVDVDHLDTPVQPGAPALVLFHGLEGSSASHYAQSLALWAAARGWALAVPHFRGCSGTLNLAPRAYHSGDFEEVGWMLQRLRAGAGRPLLAIGVSLGGNALLRWAQEAGDSAAAVVRAVAAVCAPVDLAAAGHAIGRGFNRQVYTRMFLRSMVPKALAKLQQHPGLFDGQALRGARDLYAFDNLFTAPLHGFRDTEDYWARASAKPRLAQIRIPALVLNALNDPFVPAASLPVAPRWAEQGPLGRRGALTPQVELWQPAHGGHVGFATGGFPGHVQALPAVVGGWLAGQG